MSQILALYLDFEGTKKINVLEVLIWGLEDAKCSWLGFGILVFVWIWSLVFYTNIIQILALYFDFEVAKNIRILKVQILGFGRHWRFLTKVWHFDLGLIMITGLWYTHVPNFGSLAWFWRCKEHPRPSIPHYGLWRTLEVPDWDFAYWSWFEYGHWSLVNPYSEFWLSSLILKV